MSADVVAKNDFEERNRQFYKQALILEIVDQFFTSVAQMTDYVASKHALVGLHESLRFELDTIHKTPFVRTTLVTTGHLDETSMFSGIHYNRFARFVAPCVQVGKVAEAIVDALEKQESRTIVKPWH
ncbi:hypothetical protein MEQU1_000362 [Malassezia equina]|uniref:Uncharacterized protein n=1 Tax=Malassezia equina TaxID=1381935 RepID=A0AAF0EG28_9BASI|nr:hypothetical protein MEQU1_000362 [Malassezia equina]